MKEFGVMNFGIKTQDAFMIKQNEVCHFLEDFGRRKCAPK